LPAGRFENTEHTQTPNESDDEDTLSALEQGEMVVVSTVDSSIPEKKDENDAKINVYGKIPPTVLDYGIDYTSDMDHDHGLLVRLPSGPVNANRTIPGVCAICLCPYTEGDKVSWSPERECQHAFHTDCITSWLCKKDEPKCPVCRQEFCAAAADTMPEEEVIEVDLEREAAFLETFSQALALSQLYHPSPNTASPAASTAVTARNRRLRRPAAPNRRRSENSNNNNAALPWTSMVFPGRRNNSSTIALAALEAGLHPVPAETANTPASVLENTTTAPVSIAASADASSTVEPLGAQLSVPLSIPETESSSLPLEEHASIDVESDRTSGASLADATTLPNSSSSS
jgi:Ring finger domain